MKQIEEDPGTFVRYAEPQPVETLVDLMTEAEARANVQKINGHVGQINFAVGAVRTKRVAVTGI
jgi:hypothetical protein